MSHKYVILQQDTMQELMSKVNECLEKDWVLVGGITFDKVNRPTQVMMYDASPVPKLLQKKEKKNAA